MSEITVTSEDAFEVLQVTLQKRITEMQESGAEAMRAGDYGRVQQVLDHARALDVLLGKIDAIEVEYNNLVGTFEQRTGYGRLRKGLRTHDSEYHRPLLESLVDLGGSAPLNDVLDRVYEKVQHILNEHDLAPLPSDNSTSRWRNAVHWVRYGLVKQGLMRDDSPRGVWEISDEGRRWLERQE